jgi:hypothetical protein
MRTKKYRGGAGVFGNWGKTFTEEQKAAGKIHDEEINVRKQEILAVNTPASKFIVGCIANFNNSQQFVNQFNKSTNIDSSACGSATCDARAKVIQTTLEQLLEIANRPNGAHAFASLQSKELGQGIKSYLTMGSKLGDPAPAQPAPGSVEMTNMPASQQATPQAPPQPPKKTGFLGFFGMGGSRKRSRRRRR